MTTPNLDLGTEIVTHTTTIPQAANPPTDIDVRCSTTSGLVLSGGFLTTSLPTFTEPGGAVHESFWPGLLGSGISSSGPVPADNTHSSAGWHIIQQYAPALWPTAPQPTVSTTVFAICARKSINNQAYRYAKTGGVLGAQFLDSPCQQGEFTVGGGYSFDAGWSNRLPAVPEIHESAVANSGFEFNTWRVDGDSRGAPVDALAVCIRIPAI